MDFTESEVFAFYDRQVKVIYADIEARNNLLPLELLLEIHAAFDHLRRFHVDGEPENKCAEKAYSHLKRGALDAFKLKLKWHNCDYECLRRKRGLQLIDSGKFLPALLARRNEIIAAGKAARLSEAQGDADAAFSKWYEVSNLIDEFEHKFTGDRSKFDWAQKQSLFRLIINNFFIGVLTGVIGSIIVQYLST
ncbi:MAG: hypothetical protein LBP75_08135 [Planctomycetota bacterium]|jgi:hypothetical protein|nr:hypothetical protein [Planctomycetota bacterium]